MKKPHRTLRNKGIRKKLASGGQITLRLWNVLVSPASRQVFERRQRILRVAGEKMKLLRTGSDADASFYDDLRTVVLAVGATDADIDALAVYWIDCLVEGATGHPEERDSQFELIVNHLALADMNIRIRPTPACRPSGVLVHVEFPTRPKVH